MIHNYNTQGKKTKTSCQDKPIFTNEGYEEQYTK